MTGNAGVAKYLYDISDLLELKGEKYIQIKGLCKGSMSY
ncbi:MAG: hypothetical protein MPEBLZ_00218 [Candidatus Methanoperedens nitroreducens]|uniref:Uncharacterized protein n=1 Tax=Candidatus Methanoperedens nitratireducens TaxID=1392998 RepID=A0A0P7ZJC6_9EURY|nr:MAG: hypothetical protein MPEBLZ_00218 [Candidatus Methanoperedens sp. BLZ1]